MAKDPAVLFYTSDFLSGTFTMSNEQVGKYIRLLCYQHQKGKLSEKDMLSICSAYDFEIWSKFKKDHEGYFYNERMFDEAEKRKKFSESRRYNAKSVKTKSISSAYAKHMHMHMENENENENEDINGNENRNKGKPKIEIEMPWTSDTFLLYWDHWKEYKAKDHKFKFRSQQSEQASLKELVKLSQGHEQTAIKIIEQSMAKGWKGLFELKTEINGNTKTTKTGAGHITDQQLYESLTKRFGQG